MFKDREEVGRDKLLMANLEETLRQASEARLDGKLYVDRLAAVDSEENIPVQFGDLYTSSVARVLNATGKRNSARDEFADFFLGELGIRQWSSRGRANWRHGSSRGLCDIPQEERRITNGWRLRGLRPLRRTRRAGWDLVRFVVFSQVSCAGGGDAAGRQPGNVSRHPSAKEGGSCTVMSFERWLLRAY